MSKITNVKIDWLTFSDKYHDISEVYTDWAERFGEYVSTGGKHGYRDGFYANGCDILYNGHSFNMGCCINITGKGTNLLYDQGFKLEDYIRSTIVKEPYYNVSRLDVCLDYFADCDEDMFPFDKLIDHVNNLNFVSKIHKNGRSIHIDSAPAAFNTAVGQPTATVYLGSPGSETRLRIYNKLGEQMAKARGDAPVIPDVFDGREVKQWMRFEFQLRDVAAFAFCGLLIDNPINVVFTSLLSRYIRFVEPSLTESNMSRWNTCGWWSLFLGDVNKIQI